MLFYFDRFMESWLLPPGCILLLTLLGFIFEYFKFRIGKILIFLSFIILLLLSTPWVAQHLINRLQYTYPPLNASTLPKNPPQTAIVAIEAGMRYVLPEYNNEPRVAENTWLRLEYAAFLAQKTHAPVLVSGGDPTHPTVDQAAYMAKALENDFHVKATWQESVASNTAQEGMLVTDILKNSQIKTLYLVTHAYHMPRAMAAFQNKGIVIIPAGTGYKNIINETNGLSIWLPNLSALQLSEAALREYIGILWYKLRYGL